MRNVGVGWVERSDDPTQPSKIAWTVLGRRLRLDPTYGAAAASWPPSSSRTDAAAWAEVGSSEAMTQHGLAIPDRPNPAASAPAENPTPRRSALWRPNRETSSAANCMARTPDRGGPD